MFKYPDNTYRQAPPATVEFNGFIRNFQDLTRQEWDALGYNEAVPLPRQPFTEYVTKWVKGNDLICRETVVSQAVNEAARTLAQAESIRVQRDGLLSDSDWTQLGDSPLTDAAKLTWAEYRQVLRNVPQQTGFPGAVQWPMQPE